MMPSITEIITALIAIISLIISIRAYYRDTPKLHIEIRDMEYDCFFGIAVSEQANKPTSQRIAGINFILRNHSNTKIEILDISLKIDKEFYQRIPNDIHLWRSVTICRKYDTEESINPNFSIPYNECGIHVPCEIDGYHFLTGYALFNNFPPIAKDKVKAKLIVYTALGKVQKSVLIKEYNETFENREFENLNQFFKSLKHYNNTK